MPAMTEAQLTTLKNDIAANTNTIPAGQPWTGAFAGVQVKDVPNTGDGNFAVAGWYNQVSTPNYWVWKKTVSRAEVYHLTSPDGTVWNWSTFKAQSATEQTAWIQMFMGDVAPFYLLNFRDGVFAVFSGSAAQNNQRAHIFASGRRQATYFEKLYATVPTTTGGIVVGTNNGNNLANAAGDPTNPYVPVLDGAVTADQVQTARQLP